MTYININIVIVIGYNYHYHYHNDHIIKLSKVSSFQIIKLSNIQLSENTNLIALHVLPYQRDSKAQKPGPTTNLLRNITYRDMAIRLRLAYGLWTLDYGPMDDGHYEHIVHPVTSRLSCSIS